MPKLKTNRSAAKRFRVNKTGKVKRGRAGGRHLMTGKPSQRRRRLRKTTLVGASERATIKDLLPYS
ncbi:MAG: 50S ribosomal protein L35 [Candidatus Hydrogenedentes bacterium]|nr:50S ribosomal protein L35 [Candidatus Hydrogenedentota bacterium]